VIAGIPIVRTDDKAIGGVEITTADRDPQTVRLTLAVGHGSMAMSASGDLAPDEAIELAGALKRAAAEVNQS
jgi:hypothetical protein